MGSRNTCRLKIILTAGLATSLWYGAEETFAQEITFTEEIVVTGSRIAKSEYEANSPISAITKDEVRATGTVNVEELLRDIPQTVSGVGSGTNYGSPGVATVDLRGLDEERTLVLVDGKRFTPYDAGGIVDLNMIPVSLIERIEVVTGGTSAVYGSDAIAGVVNFIMDKNFEGFEASVQYGQTEKGDGDTLTLDITTGGTLASGRGNIVVNIGYIDRKSVTQGDRNYSIDALAAADFGPGGSATTPEGTFFTSGQDMIAGDFIQFTSNGDLAPFANAFNFNPFNLLQAPQQTWNATTITDYELTRDIEFFGRLSFSNSNVDTIIAPTGTFFFPFDINYLDNPFLTAQSASVIGAEDIAAAGDPNPGDGIVTLAFGRRLVELGTRDFIFENTAYQGVGGFRGDVGEGYAWELFGQWGQTSRTINYENDVNFDRVQQALLAVTDTSGNIVCSDTSNGCAPANLFGPGNLSDAAADFIRLDLQEIDTTSQLIFGGSITGNLPFVMADREGGFAIGFEHRKEKAKHKPDANLIAGKSIGFGSSSPIHASYKVIEGFAEVLVPLVEDMDFAEAINLEAGLRYSDYSNRVGTVGNSFSNETYKVGGDWTPVRDLRFRGLYQRAVRAPNIAELGEPRTPGVGDATLDYCSGTNPAGNQALTDLCIATGVPPAAIGIVPGPIVGQVNSFVGGNPNLDPEHSHTYTFGAVVRSEALPGFIASIDYYTVKVKDAIIDPTEQSILDACYTVELSASGPNCQRILRNPLNGALIGGRETGVISLPVNAAVLRAEGIDFNVAYDLHLDGWGIVGLDLRGVHILSTIHQDSEVLPKNDCAGLVGDICEQPDPKWRFIQTTTWEYEDLSIRLSWYYHGKVTHDSIKLTGNSPSNFVVPTIEAEHYLDLTARYVVNANVLLRAGITNLLDNKPPIVGMGYGQAVPNSGNTFPQTYEPLGRAFFFGTTVNF